MLAVSVLQNGGNAVDAAVAVGFALAVTHPFAGNLGGGGFMLVRFADGRSTFIDFRERAPEKASRDMYLDATASRRGTASKAGESSGVPGTVRGFELAAQEIRQGKVGRSDLAPAIELAAKGFPVSYDARRESLKSARNLAQIRESKRIFSKRRKILRCRRNACPARSGPRRSNASPSRRQGLLRRRDRPRARRRNGE